MRLKGRSQFSGLLDLNDPTSLYYLVFALLLAVLLACRPAGQFALRHGAARLPQQRGAHARDRLPDLRYRLAAFVISALVCGLAGALLANQTALPHARRHGLDAFGRADRDGGAGRHGHAVGPIAGAAALLLLEEVLSS